MYFSLRNRLFIIFTLLLTIPMLLLSVIIPNWFTNVMEEQTKDTTVEMMDQYSLYIDSITTQAEDLGKQVLVNQSTQDWMKLEKNEEVTSSERLLMKNQLKTELSSMMINNSKSMSFSVFLNDGTGTWGDNPALKDAEWYKDFIENDQRWVKSHKDIYQPYQDIDMNSYLIPLFNLNTIELSGIIKVNFPTSLLETALSKIKLGENGRVYLIDKDGTNILSKQAQKTPEYVLTQSLERITNGKSNKGLIETNYDSEKYLMFYQKLAIGDWILISEITKSELFFKIDQLQRNLLLTSAFIFILTIIASYFLSSTIISPLGKLTSAMGYMERGEFIGAKRYMSTIKSYNHEVGYVLKVFDHTIDQLNDLIETEYQANIRRKDAEYKALLLQINPHFMNNTLEIIGGLAAQGQNKEVMNVSVYLGRMLRYSLNTHSDIVKLGEEINYIRNFTDILKVRYEDDVTIEIEENPDTKSFPIIKFIIQPLVENAVKYSFIEKTSAIIKIKTEKDNDQLFITVEDQGIGMPEEVITGLLHSVKYHETNSVLDSKGTSIGLKNVLGRLKLSYGEDFSYDIQSEKNVGTKITLCIRVTKGDRT